MNTSPKYRRLGIVAKIALAATMLFTLSSCGDDTSPDPVSPETTLVEPPDTTLAQPLDTTLIEPPDTTPAETPGPTPVDPPDPTFVEVSVRLRISASYARMNWKAG